MIDELKCPICGQATRVYMENARKDRLCGKHAYEKYFQLMLIKDMTCIQIFAYLDMAMIQMIFILNIGAIMKKISNIQNLKIIR